MKTILTVRNMVCDRCIKVVRANFEELGYTIENIELGKVEINHQLNDSDCKLISHVLSKNGFELVRGVGAEAIEKVKKLVIDHFRHKQKKPEEMNFSTYLSQEVGVNYFSLSKLFSSREQTTIERYIILQKIERVKELLLYGQLTLGEIVYELQYSSMSHLSRQFKQITGMTPTAFKKKGGEGRKPLDKI